MYDLFVYILILCIFIKKYYLYKIRDMRKFILVLSLLFFAVILFSCQSKQNLAKKKGVSAQ